MRPEFKIYARAVVDNAKALADTMLSGGYAIVAGGTDNHLMLVDLRPKGLTGKAAEAALGRAHITCNKNGVPFDPEKPMVTSGIRLGTPAAHHARLRRRGVPADRRADRRDARRACEERRPDANGDVEESVQAARLIELTRRFPDLRLRSSRPRDALPLLREPGHPGEGFPADG